MSVAREALVRARSALPDATVDELCQRCEMESIKTSVENLRTFPFVTEAIETRQLNLIGAYFDIESGEMHELDAATGEFSSLAFDHPRP